MSSPEWKTARELDVAKVLIRDTVFPSVGDAIDAVLVQVNWAVVVRVRFGMSLVG